MNHTFRSVEFLTLGPRYLCREYFKTKVHTIRVHGGKLTGLLAQSAGLLVPGFLMGCNQVLHSTCKDV